jgi:hypothetical protein
MINLLYGDSYDIWVIPMEPADCGFDLLARLRLFIILALISHVHCLTCPYEMFDAIKAAIKKRVFTSPEHALIARPEEIKAEACHMAMLRNIAFQPDRVDFTYLMTDRERHACISLAQEFKQRFNMEPESLPWLCFYLGDSPSNRLTWSAVSKKIPTYRLSNGKTFYPMAMRWLVGSERLATMGYPVHPALAKAMGVPPLAVKDVKRASDIVGNAFHMGNACTAQLLALACFGLR